MDCLIICNDLIFVTRIRATAQDAGWQVHTAGSDDQLTAALRAAAPDLALVDMACNAPVPDSAIVAIKQKAPDGRVVAFYSHVQTELAERATSAGSDQVWPRSRFVNELPGLFAEKSS